MSHGIDIFSSTSLYIELRARGMQTATATAFLWLHGRDHYLVSNWHVFSGRNPDTNQCLDQRNASLPDTVVVYFQSVNLEHEPIQIDIKLISDDFEPQWLEHPSHGRKIDIAAIKIQPPPMSIANYLAINAVPEMQLAQRNGMPIFIIGFPFKRQGLGFPVWKAGSFASEPFLSTVSSIIEPIVVDSASRPGMSGSPVIQRVYGDIDLADGSHGRTENGQGASRLVGVYAGRFHTEDRNDAQLGRVWPIKYVTDFFEVSS